MKIYHDFGFWILIGLGVLCICGASAIAGERPHKDPVPSQAQGDYIRSELRHMGWKCNVGAVLDWYCTSPDGKLVVGAYPQPSAP